MPHNNTQTPESSSALPSFVRQTEGLQGGTKLAVHYWQPERTGNCTLDYERGRQHFREAMKVSSRPDAGNFLAHVLVAMFGNLGPMEAGFVDALLDVAQFGTAPTRLTDEEIATAAASPEASARLRELEGLMAEAIAVRSWLPDAMRLKKSSDS